MPKDELPNHNCIKHLRSVVQQQQTKISELEKTVAEHKHQLGEQVNISPFINVLTTKDLLCDTMDHVYKYLFNRLRECFFFFFCDNHVTMIVLYCVFPVMLIAGLMIRSTLLFCMYKIGILQSYTNSITHIDKL